MIETNKRIVKLEKGMGESWIEVEIILYLRNSRVCDNINIWMSGEVSRDQVELAADIIFKKYDFNEDGFLDADEVGSMIK